MIDSSSARTGAADGDGPDVEILVDRLVPLLELIEASPVSLTSVSFGPEAADVHLRDSLSGLSVPAIHEAERIVDIGSGAGFPGMPLALALPEASFTLIDSVGRKAEFMEVAAEALGLANVRVLAMRSEDLAGGEGREYFDCATARAVAPLVALSELASPLLRQGGSLVAWKGEREHEQEDALRSVSQRLAMEVTEVMEVVPYPGSRPRNLYVVTKTGPTPEGLPRRPGMARKRPFSA